jgi:hypothetical protein
MVTQGKVGRERLETNLSFVAGIIRVYCLGNSFCAEYLSNTNETISCIGEGDRIETALNALYENFVDREGDKNAE